MGTILIIIIVLSGIISVNRRAENEGLFSALKSLVFLLLALIFLGISTTGVGAIIGIPALGIIAKTFAKKI